MNRKRFFFSFTGVIILLIFFCFGWIYHVNAQTEEILWQLDSHDTMFTINQQHPSSNSYFSAGYMTLNFSNDVTLTNISLYGYVTSNLYANVSMAFYTVDGSNMPDTEVIKGDNHYTDDTDNPIPHSASYWNYTGLDGESLNAGSYCLVLMCEDGNWYSSRYYGGYVGVYTDEYHGQYKNSQWYNYYSDKAFRCKIYGYETTPETIYVQFNFNNLGVFKMNETSLTNGTYNSYNNQTRFNLFGYSLNSSYVWNNFTLTNGTTDSSLINPYNVTLYNNATIWCYFGTPETGDEIWLYMFCLAFGGMVILLLFYDREKN